MNIPVSIRDLLNLQDLVNEHRRIAEIDWEGERDHEVHLWRSAYTIAVVGRTASIDQSVRMSGDDFTMFTQRRCMWQVDTSPFTPTNGLCGENVVNPGDGFNHEHRYCEEHRQDAIDNY